MNWIFFLGVGVWITIIAAFFEMTRIPAYKSFLNKFLAQPNPVTAVGAVVLMGVVGWYIVKGIELGKKEFSD